MSFCNPTYGYNSLVGNCFTTTTPTVTPPAAPFDSVQFNDAGNFGGDSSFTFDANTTTLNVPRIIVNDVGIGTVTPAYRLDVSGSAKFTTIRDTANSVGSAGQLLSSTGAALQWVAAPTPVVPAAPVNSVQFNNAGAFGGDSDFTFDSSTNMLDVNGSAKMTTLRDTTNSIGTAGQVLSSTGSALQWIATPVTAPAAPVNSVQFNNAGAFGGDSDFTFDSSTNTVRVNGKTVVGSTSSNALEVFSNGDTEIGFSYATVGNIYGKIIGDVVTASPLEGEIAFQTAFNGTLAERMRINKSGNVGIGTTAPIAPLQVGTSGATVSIGGAPVNNGTGRLKFVNSNAVKNWQISTNDSVSGAFEIMPSTVAGGSTFTSPSFLIASDGKVGLGTSSPAYELDVNGSAKFTTIRDTANSVGTAGQVLSSTGTALSWIAAGASLPCSVLKETKTAGTSSSVAFPVGTSTQKRQLNVTANSNLAVTVSGSPNWTFTIPTAGTYLFKGRAFFRANVVDSQTLSSLLVLNNNTLGLGAVIVGDSAKFGWIHASNQVQNFVAHMDGIYTISGTTVFTLDHVVSTPFQTASGGIANNLLGYQETYASLVITKLA
jgi:hypothetical protein